MRPGLSRRANIAGRTLVGLSTPRKPRQSAAWQQAQARGKLVGTSYGRRPENPVPLALGVETRRLGDRSSRGGKARRESGRGTSRHLVASGPDQMRGDYRYGGGHRSGHVSDPVVERKDSAL